MNEHDIERRLRDVVDGPQPVAPVSLRRFLQEMPEASGAGRFGRIPGLFLMQPFGRRIRLAAGVAMAVLIGLAGGAILVDLRQTPAVPAASDTAAVATPRVTPPRSISAQPNPIVARLGLMSLFCDGVPVANRGMAVPTAAIVTRAGSYLGVTDGAFGGASGASGVVHSSDGLYWAWSPPAEIDPLAIALTSIATDNLDTIVATGGVQGPGGVTDGRIWISNDDGATWQKVADESAFEGVTVQSVVYGSGQFLALGWNDASGADSLRQVAAWRSADGRNWTHVTVPIKGIAALVVPTAAGFMLSGTPLTAGAPDEPPIWHSPDGVAWTRSKAGGDSAQLIGPLLSATVTAQSRVYAVSASSDGNGRVLASSADGGLTWTTVKVDASLPHAASISHVASLNSHDAQFGDVEYVFATTADSQGGTVYASTNGGVTWTAAMDPSAGGPTGSTFLQLGDGYLVGQRRILAFGAPGSGLGIWRMGVPPSN